ncbi:MAG: hypothetical protein HY819_24620 [Acidobacteria bacterium]|nr:hypothetical protein [Acidobacteriota bacterium]
MKKRDLLFAAICVVVVSFLIFLSIRGKKPKPTNLSIPEHQNIKDLTPRERCLDCHHPQTGINDVSKRIKSTHPEKWQDIKFSCIRCHKLQTAETK